MQRGMLVQTATGWELKEDTAAMESTVPDTIRHLVARQSGRLLPEERHTLEAASVAGMEFSAASVAAALATDTVVVEHRCEQLAQRQQFLKRLGVEEWPDGTLAARYGFLHAFYQQLWHERVTPAQLQSHNLQIGERKERAYGERGRESAAELAVHFEQERDYRKAVQYLQQASENAVRRSANVEAVAHLTRGLELLKTFSDTPERAHQELTLQLALGLPLTVTKGYATPEVEAASTRALELCRQVGETPQVIPALFNAWGFNLTRGKFQTARELAERLISVAQRTHDSVALAVAHRLLAQVLYYCGEVVSARAHLEQALALYDPQQCRSLIARFGVDWGVNGFALLAHVLWVLGYPDQARTRQRVGLTLVQKIAHPLTTALFWGWDSMVHQVLREAQAIQQRAEALIALSNDQGFPQWSQFGVLHRGWALTMQGQAEDGLNQIHQSLAHSSAPQPYRLALLAEACGKTGQVEEGLTALAEALAIGSRTGEHYYEAELYRLKGELLLRKSERASRRKGERAKRK